MQRRVIVVVVVLLGMVIGAGSVFAQGGDGVPEPQAPPDGTNLPVQEIEFATLFGADEGWTSGGSPDQQLEYEVTPDGMAVRSLGEGGIGSIPVPALNLDNAYTEITITVDSCSSPESALLFFTRVRPSENAQTNDAFVYVNQCNGAYRARGLVDNQILEVAVSGTATSLVVGETYTIGYLVSGNQSAWYINGEEIVQFDIPEGASQSSGFIAPGAQLGIEYTLNSWAVWTLKNTGENIVAFPEEEAPDTPDNTTDADASADDPLSRNELGDVIYDPPFSAPTSIPLGLHHEVAAFLIDNSLLNLYNTGESGILRFADVDASNYYMQVNFEVRDCADSSTIGFVWHADEEFSSYSALDVTCDGRFEAYVVTEGEAGEPLAAGQFEPELTALNSVSLGVYVQGDTVYLYVEGQLLESYTDAAFDSGQVGLRLAAGDGSRMDILASDLLVFDVPSGE